MTISQRMIYDQVKAFVVENRSGIKTARLDMPNMFSAGDKVFINSLAEDLHLTLTWDEYDDQDQNLVSWRFPGSLEEPLDGEEESEESDDEGRAAVDRVLKKYDKAKVAMNDVSDDFDVRDEQRVKAKMDEWKRTYYWVSICFNSRLSKANINLG